jgi:hypothetical protein
MSDNPCIMYHLQGQEAPSENAQRRGSTVSSKSWSDPVDEFESGYV